MEGTYNQTRAVILSVDDSEQALALRAAILQTQGYTVLSTSSARQACVLLETNIVDAIITDHDMPDEDGIAFASRVRELGYWGIPIIMHSGSVNFPRKTEGVITEFVSKGQPTSLLLESLAAHLPGIHVSMAIGAAFLSCVL